MRGPYTQGNLIEQWNGTAWSVVPVPAGPPALHGVSCTSVSACTAVGFTAGTGNDSSTLVETSVPGTYTYAVPVVTGVSPNSGSVLGGTNITITGTGFTGATSVTFDGTAALNVVVLNDTTITATSPTIPAGGTDDVVVTNPAGTSATSSADQFTYTFPVPVVIQLSAQSGPTTGGTTVYINGSGFTGLTSVTFGGTLATIVARSDSILNVTSPAMPAGTVDVVVNNPTASSATSSADQFTFVVSALPVVTGVSPNSGAAAGGTNVVITGSGFMGVTSVNLSGSPFTNVVVVSPTTITATSPAVVNGGTYNVLVTTLLGTSPVSSADQFTSIGTLPSVYSVSPTSGPSTGGTKVTITGANFSGVTRVLFGTVPATSFSVSSSTKVTAVAPAQAAGVDDVVVATPSGPSPKTTSDQFTYIAVLPAVTSISPTSGPSTGGTTVTIRGTNLSGATQVLFGTVPATSFTVASSTKITAVAPAGAVGSDDVLVTTPSGTSGAVSADQFTYVLTLPSVTSISPTSGPTAGGTTVTIRGTNLSGATNVLFGTVPATSFTVVSSTKITAVSPAGASGSVDVLVTTPSGTSGAVSADQFTYNKNRGH
jgi:hypothetical protein